METMVSREEEVKIVGMGSMRQIARGEHQKANQATVGLRKWGKRILGGNVGDKF